jgi:PPOX class probable F420-dependent enzyme
MVSRGDSGFPAGDDYRRVLAAQVARLATVRPDGAPHLVPVTLAVEGKPVVTAVDHKPKRTTDLQRLRNVAVNPSVSLLVDAYDTDWSQLWWVRLDARAQIVTDEPRRSAAAAVLRAKYEQYADRPPDGPVLLLSVTRWASWSATG